MTGPSWTRQLGRRLGGHAWTVLADAKHRVAPLPPPPAVPWSVRVADERVGSIELSGALHEIPEADDALLIVHGLGGSADSGYAIGLARAAAARGWSSLRINLRGADARGEDVYHAGLTSDLEAALNSPAFRRHRSVHAVGVSLGGHVVLRLALQPPSNLRAVVAVSAPLDLALSCRAIDRRRAWPYRTVVLRSLRAAYQQVVDTHGDGPRVPATEREMQDVRSIRAWDDRVVVRRHGFDSVAHYHRTMSVGPHLRALQCPALYVGSPHDPMVPGSAVLPSLNAAGDALEVVMLERGGHVGLPAPALHSDAPPTLPDQLVAWLHRRTAFAPG